MLQLARQGPSALRTRFICTSCRALLDSGATRLPGAVTKLCAARHYSSDQQPPTQKQAQQGTETAGQQTTAGKESKKPWQRKPTKPSQRGRSPRRRPPSASGPPTSPTARHQLWRETLKVLKDIKADQCSSPPQAKHAAASGSEPRPNKAKEPPARDPKLLEGALVMLKEVLHHELRDDSGMATETAELAPSEEPPAAPPKEDQAAPPKRSKSLAEALGFVRPKADAKPADAPAEEPTDQAEKPAAKASSKPSKAKSASSSSQASKPLSKLTPNSKLAKQTNGKGKRDFVVNRIDAAKIDLTAIEKEQPPVPKLAYGLDRVLFNPGVYHIQDPRSRVFNFDPYLERIMPIKEFDFNAIKQYVTSSKDTTLIQTAADHGKKYTGSTSSMTSTLAHFHYLLSAWRPINPSMVSKDFEVDSHRFTRIMRAPAATFLHWKDGTYAIDADKEFDTANILSMLGKSMEKFLTLPKEEFEKYRKTNSDQLTEEERNGPESYHYTTLGDFMMRSQLDAYDPRLPGTGMFDLKTRAVVSIRMDARDFKKGLGYEIRNRFGQWESFEREYYDMIRSAFLKYSLQVRMGRMDGIFVAYHNTERIFGFQYIPLEEMDLSLHGQTNLTLGDREFKLSLHLLNKVLDKVTAKYPGRSLRLHFETRGEETPFTYIFAKPVTPVEIEEIQGATRAKVEEFERQMMGVVEDARALEDEDGGEEAVDEVDEHDLDEGESEEITSSAAWEDVMLKVEDELEDEEHGVTFVREAIEDALQESGLLRTTAPDETQRYVDAFLEALTSNGRRAASEDQESAGLAESGDAESAVESAAEANATTTGPAEAEQVEEESGEEPQEDAQSPAAEDASADEPTLKDLIVKLATQIRAVPSEQRTPPGEDEGIVDEDAPEYALKLRKIERILSELTEQPQEGDKPEEGVGSGVIESGTVVMESGEQAWAAEAVESTESVEPTETVEPTESVEPVEQVETAEPTEPAEKTDEPPVESEAPAKPSEDAATPSEDSAAPPPESAVEAEETSAETTEAAEQLEKTDEQPAEETTKAGEDTPTTTTTTTTTTASPTKHYVDEADGAELYGLILTVRNKVDGEYVARPENLRAKQRWQVEYAIEEVKPERAHNLYKMVLKRRKNLLYGEESSSSSSSSSSGNGNGGSKSGSGSGNRGGDRDRWYYMFQGRLERYSTRGRQFRRREQERRRGAPVHVYGEEGPLPYESVFGGEEASGGNGNGDWDGGEEEGSRKGSSSKGKKKKD